MTKSHPAWVCGLKPRGFGGYAKENKVTPCVGVWIETEYWYQTMPSTVVTPCVGVWIETIIPVLLSRLGMSHPAWVCGLKLPIWRRMYHGYWVTPCVGVWIETTNLSLPRVPALSHPAWVCGLKLILSLLMERIKGHTLRGCVDWNLTDFKASLENDVTPCVGVWIETYLHCYRSEHSRVTPCVGVWIETYLHCYRSEHSRSHTLRGCVDWNCPLCVIPRK